MGGEQNIWQTYLWQDFWMGQLSKERSRERVSPGQTKVRSC